MIIQYAIAANLGSVKLMRKCKDLSSRPCCRM